GHIEMPYPYYHFVHQEDEDSLTVLIIGDSFFWQWHDDGRIAFTFPVWQFWYYNQGIYPQSYSHYTNAYSLDLMDTIQGFDLILILQTMGGEGRLGFGFLQRAYCDLLFPGRIEKIIQQIRSNPEWFKAVESKAKMKNLPLETVLTREAIYCIYQSQENKHLTL
ncbi:MAG: hypothetical protein JXA23_03105, partial [Bacteroidales bacterium]|nr:hypothetical protein [Bacteroidales bacterium]